ncbi:MAG: FMN-binding protein [Clostridiales bacterium]|jgi:uncharacterized protein with FMN-binding domain|nr:FMN-binding protein [Clostridiales bacterium]
MKVKMRNILIICGLMVAVGLGLFLNYLWSVEKYKNKIDKMVFSNISIDTLNDGIYEGEYDVDFIYAKVRATIKDGEMTELKLLEHKNDRGTPAEVIIEDILEQQIVEVDAISGATNSSKVIKKAVENALEKAKGKK